MTIYPIQALTSVSAPANGTPTDVSPFIGDWVLKIRVTALPQGSTVRFQFTETLDAFMTKLAGPTVSFAGGFGGYADEVRSIRKNQFLGSFIGQAYAQVRCDLTILQGGGPVTYQAWIEA